MAQETCLVGANGKRKTVVVPLKRYRRLMDDLHDMAVVAERRDEEEVSLNDLKERLRRDGLPLAHNIRHREEAYRSL